MIDVISMPQVPPGAVALIDRIGRRWTRTTDPDFDGWQNDLGGREGFVPLLWAWGPLTVEFDLVETPEVDRGQ